MTPLDLDAIDDADPKDCRALIAEVRRLRALPVIATCGACGWCRVSGDPGNVNDRCAHPSAEQSGQWPEPDATIAACAPPAWCPLRGAK